MAPRLAAEGDATLALLEGFEQRRAAHQAGDVAARRGALLLEL
jgi:hypothetical protein